MANPRNQMRTYIGILCQGCSSHAISISWIYTLQTEDLRESDIFKQFRVYVEPIAIYPLDHFPLSTISLGGGDRVDLVS